MNKENKKVEKKELSRILIANRGEIALRAIQTIQEMGKESVAIYSIADKDAHYLNTASAKVCIGGGQIQRELLEYPCDH